MKDKVLIVLALLYFPLPLHGSCFYGYIDQPLVSLESKNLSDSGLLELKVILPTKYQQENSVPVVRFEVGGISLWLDIIDRSVLPLCSYSSPVDFKLNGGILRSDWCSQSEGYITINKSELKSVAYIQVSYWLVNETGYRECMLYEQKENQILRLDEK